MTRTFIPPLTALLLLLLLAACSPAATPVAGPTEAPAPLTSPTDAVGTDASMADLATVKSYTLERAATVVAGSEELLAVAQRYYDLAAESDFDYARLLSAHDAEVVTMIEEGRAAWLTSSEGYELAEGIIAGVPSLSEFDVLLDAGPSAEEAPDEALDWTLTLPDGSELKSPGNYFHTLLEPLLWQTNPDFMQSVGEAPVPDANHFLGMAQGLAAAATEMREAVKAWEPTLSDAFTALVVMVPTMNEYFEQWKLSSYVAGEEAEQQAFIGKSRLFDIKSILNGLDVTYKAITPLVEEADPAQHAQIVAGFADLITYVNDLYDQEQAGTRFSAEEADLFGTEAQDRATTLAGQISQVAALLKVEIQE